MVASLNSIKESDKEVAMSWVASQDANFLIGNDNFLSKPDFNINERPWHKGVISTEEVYFTDPYMDEVFGKVILSVMKQVKDGDKTIGVVAIDIFLDALVLWICQKQWVVVI